MRHRRDNRRGDDRGGQHHDPEEQREDRVGELLFARDHPGVVTDLTFKVLPLQLEQDVEEPRHRLGARRSQRVVKNSHRELVPRLPLLRVHGGVLIPGTARVVRRIAPPHDLIPSPGRWDGTRVGTLIPRTVGGTRRLLHVLSLGHEDVLVRRHQPRGVDLDRGYSPYGVLPVAGERSCVVRVVHVAL